MRITKIEGQKHNPSRKNIYIDGEFALGISAETLLRFGLRTGDEIGEQKLKALQAAEELQGAQRVALQLLARRPRTEKEIRDRLREKEFGEEEIDQAVASLRKSGFLDDEAFARAFIRDQLSVRPKGPLAIKRRLLLLGVKKETIDRALNEAFQERSQNDVALDVAVKFLRKISHDDPRSKRQKLAGFLSRRGFSWDVITEVMNKVLGATDHGDAL
jgi:regulatory protein